MIVLSDIGSDQRDRLQGEQAQRCRQHSRQHLRFKGSLCQGTPGFTCSASPRSHRWELRKGGGYEYMHCPGDLSLILSKRKNLEILKIRFGEAPLQVCEVMLKDMTDSKRIDQHVQSQSSVSG